MSRSTFDSICGLGIPTYQRGGVSLYCGDSLQLLPLLEAGSVGAIVCDPPYGINLENHSKNACMNGSKRRRKRDWTIAGDSSSDAALVVAKWSKGIPLAMFGSPYVRLPGNWRNLLVWDKGPAVGGGGDPSTCWKRTWELIYVANNKALRLGRDSAVLRFHVSPNYSGDFDLHPAQKPIALMRYLVEQLTDHGDTVLDPFIGSGTTAVACVQTGRRCLGIEIDRRYFDIACKRVDAAIDQLALFEPVPPAVTRDMFAAIEETP